MHVQGEQQLAMCRKGGEPVDGQGIFRTIQQRCIQDLLLYAAQCLGCGRRLPGGVYEGAHVGMGAGGVSQDVAHANYGQSLPESLAQE
ncbi:protein of unknown function [Paenibacillus alvei]|uniref:Uncharacterized protein n=1 Tax=Paenibacillus alvei TaxID=44250 RepID=A0A383RMQ1_PAEAL|nr:protein of unknown function [Paenibacillus alvei]